MSFEHRAFLFLLPLSLVAVALLAAGDARRRRAAAALGDHPLVEALVTADAATRRTVKGALRVLALALTIVAAAGPRYGRGTKVVPAADVQAMLVLDLSKSMYAQDVLPSRLERARNDATRMIKALPTVRWGAVVFAGEALGFAPTTDGPEAAAFLGAYQPHSMPGGTAIARALEVARQKLLPDPAKPATARRKSVIVLVTDGEDLEGDPVAVARRAFEDGVRIHVVAVGGRAPQPIPVVDPQTGQSTGTFVRDEAGNLVTTELTKSAEDQLAAIAQETTGLYVRTSDGTTGLAQIEAALRAQVATEGVEHVETLYAHVYHWPLGLAVLLLLADTLLGEARRRRLSDV